MSIMGKGSGCIRSGATVADRHAQLLRAERFAGLDDARETLRAVPPHALEEIAARHGWTFRRYIRLPGEQTIAAEEWMRTGARNVMIPADPSLDDCDSRVFDFCVKVAKASHLAPAEVLAEVFEEAEDR